MCIKKYVRSVVVLEDHFIKFKKGLDKNVIKKIYQVFIMFVARKTRNLQFLGGIATRLFCLTEKTFVTLMV